MSCTTIIQVGFFYIFDFLEKATLKVDDDDDDGDMRDGMTGKK